jgi:hypothetical protein
MAYQIPGAIISAAEKAKAAASAAIEAAQPTYAQMLETIKSGEIHKDISGQLSALGNLGINTTSISEVIAKAKASMSIDMAVANAAFAQKAKMAQAAGTTLSEADKTAAMAPLGVLKNLQSTISTTMTSVASSVSSYGTTLGISPSATNPTAAINSVAAAATAFSATVPAQTIPDPLNPGQTITNPAYTTFASNPTNASKIAALSSISSAASTAGTNLTNTLAGFAATAAAGKSDIISTLKADAMLASLTKPMPALMSSVTADSLNLNKIDKYAAIKAQEATATVAVQKTPDTIRPSGGTKLTDSTTAPAPTDTSKFIFKYELKALGDEYDKIRDTYYKSFGTTKEATPDQQQAAYDAWWEKQLGTEKEAIRKQSVAIQKAKPDAATRTEEENAIIATSKANGKIVRETPEYIRVQVTYWGDVKKYEEWYKLAYNNWKSSGNRYELPAELEAKLKSYK